MSFTHDMSHTPDFLEIAKCNNVEEGKTFPSSVLKCFNFN